MRVKKPSLKDYANLRVSVDFEVDQEATLSFYWIPIHSWAMSAMGVGSLGQRPTSCPRMSPNLALSSWGMRTCLSLRPHPSVEGKKYLQQKETISRQIVYADLPW